MPRAIAIVSSVLSESTTTISSAQATESIASATWAASFLVMIVTESFGTAGVYLRAGRLDRHGSGFKRSRSVKVH